MAILVKDPTGKWVEAKSATYDCEKELQLLLSGAPELLDELDDGSLVFTREASLSNTACADLIGVRADGTVLLVETKLARNPEIRRKVTGQIIEYASLLWKLNYRRLDAFFRRNNAPSLYEQSSERARVNGKVCQFPTLEEFRTLVEKNLELGRIKLLIVVDQITDDLERVVAYLTSLGGGINLEALAVRKHLLDDREALVLQRYGIAQALTDVAAAVAKQTVEEILARAANTSIRDKVQMLLDGWTGDEDLIEPGVSGISFKAQIFNQKLSFFWASPNEQWGLQPQFAHLEQHGLPRELAEQLRTAVGSLPGFDIQRCRTMSYPSTKWHQITPATLGQFLKLMHECREQWIAQPDAPEA